MTSCVYLIKREYIICVIDILFFSPMIIPVNFIKPNGVQNVVMFFVSPTSRRKLLNCFCVSVMKYSLCPVDCLCVARRGWASGYWSTSFLNCVLTVHIPYYWCHPVGIAPLGVSTRYFGTRSRLARSLRFTITMRSVFNTRSVQTRRNTSCVVPQFGLLHLHLTGAVWPSFKVHFTGSTFINGGGMLSGDCIHTSINSRDNFVLTLCFWFNRLSMKQYVIRCHLFRLSSRVCQVDLHHSFTDPTLTKWSVNLDHLLFELLWGLLIVVGLCLFTTYRTFSRRFCCCKSIPVFHWLVSQVVHCMVDVNTSIPFKPRKTGVWLVPKKNLCRLHPDVPSASADDIWIRLHTTVVSRLAGEPFPRRVHTYGDPYFLSVEWTSVRIVPNYVEFHSLVSLPAAVKPPYFGLCVSSSFFR